MDKCPTCQRPYKKLANHERARSNVGTGHEQQVARSLGDMGKACQAIHELLLKAQRIANGWVSRDRLSRELNGGDGARRARQLRDEYGVPIEVKMVVDESGRRQAYYRIAEPAYFEAFHAFDRLMDEPTEKPKTLFQLAQEGAFDGLYGSNIVTSKEQDQRLSLRLHRREKFDTS